MRNALIAALVGMFIALAMKARESDRKLDVVAEGVAILVEEATARVRASQAREVEPLALGIWRQPLGDGELVLLHNGGQGLAYEDFPESLKADLLAWHGLEWAARPFPVPEVH